MTRCVIYFRYSTDMQKEESLIDQEREAREYAEKNGWEIVRVYADAALSGGSAHRPEFEQLMTDAEKDCFDIVLSESLDRLSRNLTDISKLHDELSFVGVRLFTIQYGEMNKMLVGFLGTIADNFVADLRAKVKRGQRGRVINGKTAGGVGYGYTVGEPGDRTIDPDQAVIVNRIFSMYADVLKCGVCGGPLAITAKDRYGCSAYRASKTCNNKKTILRLEVEERVLEGLRSGLLNSEYLDQFTAEFQNEVERLRKTSASELSVKKKRLIDVKRQIDRIVAHIVNGTDSKTITSKLVELEDEKDSLESEVAQVEEKSSIIPIHNIGQLYRTKIRQLTEGLTDPALRQRAIDTIQDLIDHIKVTPTNTGFDVELHGELGAIMEMVGQNERRPAGLTAGRSLSVVAGVGFEPTTFRL